MIIQTIDTVVDNLVKTHETRDPFEIAKNLGVIIIQEDLGEVFGYYNRLKRIKFIHINENLPEELKRLTCAHELGHAIISPDENTPLLSKTTIVSELKIEKEANYFATNLIIDGSHEECHFTSYYDVLNFYGLPCSFKRFLN